jgi:hypothetical protein
MAGLNEEIGWNHDRTLTKRKAVSIEALSTRSYKRSTHWETRGSLSEEDSLLHDDKENRSRNYAQTRRIKPTASLQELIHEYSTDSSDLEISVEPTSDSIGHLYYSQRARVYDEINSYYHFDVYEDETG